MKILIKFTIRGKEKLIDIKIIRSIYVNLAESLKIIITMKI